MRRRLCLACTILVAGATPASAQKLRDQLAGLLTFGGRTVPLQVGTLAPGGQAVLPSDAFRTVGANAQFGSFLVNWMTASSASTPLASTGGGRSFRFAGGVPVQSRPAPGPIFGERATTLGRGAVLAGASYTGVRFTRVRGVPLDAVRLTLTQGGAAADVIDLRASLDYDTGVTALFATAGVLDRVDVGLVLPLVHTRLRGESTARVIAGAAGTPTTVLGGTADAPTFSSQQAIGGRTTGLGDVALRAKLNLVDRPAGGFALLGDVRLPTGDAADLLGSGAFSARALAVYSGRFGGLTPHANAGYLYFADRAINDAFLATAGVDADLVPWATVSLSAVGQFQAGASAYRLPRGQGTASLANIPEIRDDALSASFGAKFDIGGVRAAANVLAPFTRGGPRPDLAYTFGVERAF
jgi:hypothetical protein